MALIQQRAGIPPSEYIRLVPGKDKLGFYLSSDAIGKVEIPASGKWPVEAPYFVDRNLFLPFITAAKTSRSVKDFDFGEFDKQLVITQGRRKITFARLPPVTGYGKIELDGKVVELSLSDGQKELMRCAESCATSDPTTPHLNCVYVTEDGKVLASNQIVIFCGDTKKFKHSIPMPLYLLSMLETDGANKLLFTKRHVLLQLDHGEILQSVPQKALKGFPVKKITSRIKDAQGYQKLFVVSAAKLSEILTRFSSYMNSVRRQDRVIRVSIKKGEDQLKVTSEVAQVKLAETLKLKSAPKTTMKAEWPLDLVLPVLAFLGSKDRDLVVSANDDSPYYVDGGDVKLILARKV